MSNALLANYATKTPQKFFNAAYPLGAATDPVFRAIGSVVSSFTSGTQAPVIPSTAVVGDLLVAIFQTNHNTGVITPPAGWTTITSTIVGFWNFGVFVKKCVAGDPGAANNFTATGSGDSLAYVVAYSNYDAASALTSVVKASVVSVSTAAVTATNPDAMPSRYMEFTHYFSGVTTESISSQPAMTARIPPTGFEAATIAAYELADGVGQTLTWATATNAGAINIWIAGTPTTSPVGTTPLYTCPANTRAMVEEIAITNQGAVAAPCEIALGGVDIFDAPVPPGTTFVDIKQVLTAGDTIQAGTTTTSGLSLYIAGKEVT